MISLKKLIKENNDVDIAKEILRLVGGQKLERADDDVFLSKAGIEQIKNKFGNPTNKKIMPGPEKGVRLVYLLNIINGKEDFYTDDGDFVKGDKTILPYKNGRTALEYIKASKVKI